MASRSAAIKPGLQTGIFLLTTGHIDGEGVGLMALQVNVHEAETHFCALLVEARKGQEVIITNAGRPVARIVPMREGRVRRMPGKRGKSSAIGGTFATLLPENVLAEFES